MFNYIVLVFIIMEINIAIAKFKIEKSNKYRKYLKLINKVLLRFKIYDCGFIFNKEDENRIKAISYLAPFLLLSIEENKDLILNRALEIEKEYFDKALKEAQEESLEIIKGNI